MATAAPSPQAAPATPFGGAAGIRVRMYRVGFGDFFLLSAAGDDGQPRHILIDCGVHAGDLHSIGAAIDRLAEDTGKQLALVVMTHRHADHISGFATGQARFAEFTIEQVWMPWFEDPKNSQAVAFQAGVTALAERLAVGLAARGAAEDARTANMMTNITGQMGVAGAPSGNALALKVLHGGFANQPAIHYYQAGDPTDLPQSLIDIGLTATILGPPIDVKLVAQMDGKTHQYLQAADIGAAVAVRPFDPVYETTAAALTGLPADSLVAIEANVKAVQPNLLTAMAQQADNSINNQSLVILFRKAGKSLLFAGDAQWGNWQNFLFGGTFGTPGHTEMKPESKAILAALDFYKVGHHGSTNATPIDALQAMRQGLVAMCSTERDCYGHEDKGTEVPRVPLMAALDQKTGHQIARSDQVAVGNADLFDTALPDIFRTSGEGFIDYLL